MLLCEKTIRRWIKEWGQAQSSLPAEPALGNATQCQRPIWTGWQPTSTRWMRPCSSTRCRKFSFSSLGAATTAAQFVLHKLSKIAQRENDFVRSVWQENMAGVDSSRFIFLDETRRFVERAFAFIASSPAPRAATAPSQCSRWTASLGFQSPGPRGLTLELSRTIYAQCYSQF